MSKLLNIINLYWKYLEYKIGILFLSVLKVDGGF